MLETLVEQQVIFFVLGAAVGIGALSKLITRITLGKMVKAAGNMDKSNHKLVRLVRAKFEHASMLSDRVQNVEAFVKKYVYEYRVCGMRLYSFQNLGKAMIWISVIAGVIGIGASYSAYGVGEQMLQYGVWAVASVVILCMLHISGDEKYRLQMAENYMVDYLENVCAYRYAKMYKPKENNETSTVEQEESFLKENEAEKETKVTEQAEEKSSAEAEHLYAMRPDETDREESRKEAMEEKRLQEVQVRKILEEFLA